MKKIIMSLVVLVPLWLQAQNKDVAGNYYLNQDDYKRAKFVVKPDNTFEMVFITGKYTQDKDGRIYFEIDKPADFKVKETEKGQSDKITIELKTGYLTPNDLKSFYIGYQDQDKKMKYLNALNLYDSSPENNSEEVMDYYDYLGQFTFEIPKTTVLHLVNAYRLEYKFSREKGGVWIDEYNLSKDVKTLEVTVNASNFVYNTFGVEGVITEEGNLKLSEIGGDEGELYIREDKIIPDKTYLEKVNSTVVQDWEHLITFDDKSKEEQTGATYKIEVKQSLDEALKQTKKNNQPLIVFYQPENTSARKKDFESLIKQLEQDNSYTLSTENNKVNYYFADKKDEKWIKKNKISNKNQILVLDSDGMVLYHEENTPSEITQSLRYSGTILQVFRGIYTLRTLDKLVQNKKTTIAQYQAVFKELLENGMLGYIYQKNNRSEAQVTTTAQKENQKVDTEKEVEEVVEAVATAAAAVAAWTDYDYYMDYLKDWNAVYKIKTTRDQINQIWKKIIQSHKNDKNLDLEYAKLIGLNYFSYRGDYHTSLFDTSRRYDQTDLDAMTYVVKFYKEIKKIEEAQTPDDYYNSSWGYWFFSDHNLDTKLDKIAEDSSNLLNPIKSLYKQAFEQDIIRFDSYNYFIEKYFPEEHLEVFGQYFDSIVTGNEHIIVALDKSYSSSRERDEYGMLSSDWTYYKMLFANNANNTAWVAVEKHRDDKQKVAKALKWSAVSVELDPENPYYLDTYAHLLYLKGDRNKAIEIQRKAVKIIQDSPNIYNQGNEDTIMEALDKMIKGNL
ncbi:MAG: hypothetical protein Q4B43_06635 [Bacteroidota bacterium]|nr:hypothetical protein [Bacteroidota bacterium]